MRMQVVLLRPMAQSQNLIQHGLNGSKSSQLIVDAPDRILYSILDHLVNLDVTNHVLSVAAGGISVMGLVPVLIPVQKLHLDFLAVCCFSWGYSQKTPSLGIPSLSCWCHELALESSSLHRACHSVRK